MKTSFYFLLWISIYPLLGLLGNSFVDNNAFLFALAAVFGLSWLLRRTMPRTISYEQFSSVAPILEDVYTGNVASFRKRLSREACVETVTAVYFCVTTALILFVALRYGGGDWVSMGIFLFFTIGAVTRSVSLAKGCTRLRQNPTREECAEIVRDTYRMNYDSYREARSATPYTLLFPERPRNYKVFRWFSIVVAAIVSVLGLFYIVTGSIVMFGSGNMAGSALACMYSLYGSLAAYYGIKDFITLFRSLRHC
ncbi:MAG: hypothetical protein NC336_05810 [Clostridium sp.]|nr:hypothetical protein [Clostridium sp.]